MLNIPQNHSHPLSDRFAEFIGASDFPCVGAKAALNRDGIRFVVARDFGSAWDDLRILPGLLDLAKRYRADPVPFQSLVVLFESGAPDDEEAYETHLWARLKSLSDEDEWLGQRADPRVAHDPDDPHFAMRFGVEAFFVVGAAPQIEPPGAALRSAGDGVQPPRPA